MLVDRVGLEVLHSSQNCVTEGSSHDQNCMGFGFAVLIQEGWCRPHGCLFTELQLLLEKCRWSLIHVSTEI